MIKKIIETYKEIISYLFFGVCTTVVNFIIYFACTNLLDMNYLLANALSWAGAVTFAYVTNRIWVFQSKNRGIRAIFKEIIAFVGCRLLSGVMDMLIMFIGVDVLGIPDSITKFMTQVVVVVLNYIFSKLIIFRK
ncbi:MAG: GtrA family protein [Lachnospiraceae bacterium]|nr:GtrA family protein [Lachnospiraceae bacterium]